MEYQGKGADGMNNAQGSRLGLEKKRRQRGEGDRMRCGGWVFVQDHTCQKEWIWDKLEPGND